MLDEIVLFITLYENKSFTNAAQLLQIKTSTLSKRISNLEENLGKKLITRTTRNFKPTEFGKYIYNKFKHLPSFTKETLEIYNNNDVCNQSGQINICLGSIVAYEYICPHLNNFIEKYPYITLNIELIHNIKQWPSPDVDIVLSIQHLDEKKFDNRFLMSERFFLYCNSGYAVKHKLPTTPEELINHKIISLLYYADKPVKFFSLKNLITDKIVVCDLSNSVININSSQHAKKIGMSSNMIFPSADIICKEELANESLVKVLPEWEFFQIDLFLVTKKIITPLQQIFIDFIYQVIKSAKLNNH